MYYQNYEDYMRSVLGYPMQSNNTYEAYFNPYEQVTMPYNNFNRNSEEMLNLYPEIYKIINPMVCKICDANTKPISRELIQQMTDEIYANIETQPEIETVVNVRVNTSPEENKESRRINNSMNSTSQYTNHSAISQNRTNKEKEEVREVPKEDRQRRPINRTLRDLIQILILNQLLGGNFPNRPSYPPRPPMPPRPPIRPPYPRSDTFYDNF